MWHLFIESIPSSVWVVGLLDVVMVSIHLVTGCSFSSLALSRTMSWVFSYCFQNIIKLLGGSLTLENLVFFFLSHLIILVLFMMDGHQDCPD